MNIDELTIGEARKIAAMFDHADTADTADTATIDNGMIGNYVIVRCRDAGVHAGVLMSHNGRECVLGESRRLWYWKPANNAAFLSGVASEGLHEDSKIGAPVTVHLTENCEIIQCTHTAEESIKGAPSYAFE